MSRTLAGEDRETGDRGAVGKIPVFGILERGGKVRVDIVKNISGETLVTMARKR